MKTTCKQFSIILIGILLIGFASSCDKDGEEDNKKENTNSINDDEGVVINGVRWATRNVDAPGTFTSKPEDFGMFYQWNSNIGWKANQLINSNGETAWNSSWTGGYSTPSSSDIWTLDNDPSPTGWRIPTGDEIALLRAAPNEWATVNGVYGRMYGTPPNTIFFPMAGYRNYGSGRVEYAGMCGRYWGSTAQDKVYTNTLDFFNSTPVGFYPTYRSCGFNIRCVAK